MNGLFSATGVRALRRLAHSRSMLAFDLDGTLAPIVEHPADASVPRRTAAMLRTLARMWPLAVITGRAAEDACGRLHFVPGYLFGNHGAEPSRLAMSELLRRALDPCRDHLQRYACELRGRCIEVEDKGLSLALHHRHAVDPRTACGWLESLVASFDAGVQTSRGHAVLNITPAGAPDKGDALLDAMRACGALQTLMVGDDTNDEPAFAAAPAGSVSVRIGPLGTATLAQFRLGCQSQMDRLLSQLLRLRC